MGIFIKGLEWTIHENNNIFMHTGREAPKILKTLIVNVLVAYIISTNHTLLLDIAQKYEEQLHLATKRL